jgi:hypothetical protein
MKTFETNTTSYLVALNKNCWVSSFKDDTFLNSPEAKSFKDNIYEIAPFMSAGQEFDLPTATRIQGVFQQKGFEQTAVILKEVTVNYEYSLVKTKETNKSSKKKG